MRACERRQTRTAAQCLQRATRIASLTSMSGAPVRCLLPAALALVVLVLMLNFRASAAGGNGFIIGPQRRSTTRPPVTRSSKARVDYSRFSHTSHVTRQKLACDSCHKVPTKNWNQVRKGDAAFPDVAEFPEHQSC